MGGEEFANIILGFGGLEDNFLLQVRSESGAYTLYRLFFLTIKI